MVSVAVRRFKIVHTQVKSIVGHLLLLIEIRILGCKNCYFDAGSISTYLSDRMYKLNKTNTYQFDILVLKCFTVYFCHTQKLIKLGFFNTHYIFHFSSYDTYYFI